MKIEEDEEQAITLIMPYLEKICRGRWKNLEYEERLSEACFIFLCSFRTFSINTGNFIADFENVLIPYMDEKNRGTPSKYYGEHSLDMALHTKNDSENWCRYDFLESSAYDDSVFYVNEFLKILSVEQRMIVYDLYIRGLPKVEIARKHGLSMYRLHTILKQIGNKYMQEYWKV